MTGAVTPAPVHYTLSLPRPENHLIEVEMTIVDRDPHADPVRLSMAGWTPGSYAIRDYARYVRDVRAENGDGAALAVTKLDKQTWAVDAQRADAIVVRYRVYGHELSAHSNHVDGTHALLHPPATYLTVAGLQDAPCRVTVRGPAHRDWRVATGLEPDGDSFLAADTDELLDCPIHVGDCDVRSFEVCGAPVQLVIWGQFDGIGVVDVNRLVSDLAAVTSAHAARFGDEVPFRHYTFLLMVSPGEFTGIEHRNSSTNLTTPFALHSHEGYEYLLEMLSHEFFHVWNGKRICPAALSHIDYSGEAYTRCLWLVEGLTSYYDLLTLVRVKAVSATDFLDRLAYDWCQLRATPGRQVHSLNDASLDAWIKLYKPDECNVNTTVSFYLKGKLVAMALDLIARKTSGGARSLDDALALLWREFGHTGAPYPEDLQPIFERALGCPLHDLFERCVRGHDDPDLPALLAHVGLELREIRRDSRSVLRPSWLGVMCRDSTVRVTEVCDGSPAERAGVSPGDELVALDRWKLDSRQQLVHLLEAREPGDRVEVALFRRGQLLLVPVELAAAPPGQVEVVTLDPPSAEQKAMYVAWLGEWHPGAARLIATGENEWV